MSQQAMHFESTETLPDQEVHEQDSSGVHLISRRTAVAEDDGDSRPSQTTVRFIEGEGGCSVLEVETSDRSGFVHGLSLALIHESVEIVRAEVRRVTGGIRDRFVIADKDGSPLSAAKRLALQVAVLSAVDLAS